MRLFHSSNSGRRAIQSESGRFEDDARARSADGYIHGVRSAIGDIQLLKPSAEEEEEFKRKAAVAEVQKKSTPERPLANADRTSSFECQKAIQKEKERKMPLEDPNKKSIKNSVDL